MAADAEDSTDTATVTVPLVGRLIATGEPLEPYKLLCPNGTTVEAVSIWFAELQAADRSVATLRSYGMDLLRWFRFLWALGVPWDRATRAVARDFARWMLVAGKPARPHWRNQDAPVTATGSAYSPSVRAHSETVLRSFYDPFGNRLQMCGPAPEA